MKTPLEQWLDRVNLLRAKAERLDQEAKQAWVEYDKALNSYPGNPLQRFAAKLEHTLSQP